MSKKLGDCLSEILKQENGICIYISILYSYPIAQIKEITNTFGSTNVTYKMITLFCKKINMKVGFLLILEIVILKIIVMLSEIKITKEPHVD